jgi:hypothetical protein
VFVGAKQEPSTACKKIKKRSKHKKGIDVQVRAYSKTWRTLRESQVVICIPIEVHDAIRGGGL